MRSLTTFALFLFTGSSSAAPIVTGGGQEGVKTDLFDVAQGTTVLSSSPMLGVGSQPENAFGGTGGVEPQHTLFSDGPITTIEFINFRTAAPIHLTSYIATLADESDNPANPGDPHRGVMGLFLSTSPDATFTNPTVVSATQVNFPYTTSYGSNAIQITDSTIDVTAQFFRVELVRANDGGPRIRELDGFGTIVPEPGGGAILLTAILPLVLRRRGE